MILVGRESWETWSGIRKAWEVSSGTHPRRTYRVPILLAWQMLRESTLPELPKKQ